MTRPRGDECGSGGNARKPQGKEQAMKAKKAVPEAQRQVRQELKSYSDTIDLLTNFDELVAAMGQFANGIIKQYPPVKDADGRGSRWPDEFTHAIMLRDGVKRMIDMVEQGDARGAAVEAIRCERHQQTICYLMDRTPANYGYKKLMHWRGTWLEVSPNERRILDRFTDESRIVMEGVPSLRKAVAGLNKKLKAAGMAVSLHFQRDYLVLKTDD